jgi:hypothetical protein
MFKSSETDLAISRLEEICKTTKDLKAKEAFEKALFTMKTAKSEFSDGENLESAKKVFDYISEIYFKVCGN